MQFKVDENLPVEFVAALRAGGYNALAALEQFSAGTSDTILAAACRAEGRILLTCDLDFADIRAYPPHGQPGVIVFRLKRQSKPRVLAAFARLLPLLSTQPIDGRLWIVDEDSVRIRA